MRPISCVSVFVFVSAAAGCLSDSPVDLGQSADTHQAEDQDAAPGGADTVAGIQFGNLISGALLVETVFNWPGMGRLAFDSILRRDYPTVLGVLFFSAIMVVVANLLTDLSYRLADPRIRTGGKR